MVSDALGWLCIWKSQNLLAFACISTSSLLTVNLADKKMRRDDVLAL